MRLLLLIGALVALSASASAQAGADFTYDDIVTLIRSQNLTSLEELLPQLPADLRSNYTLMKSSGSLHGAEPLRPRAILFGSKAKLVCAFNAGGDQVGGDNLECIQFRDSERAFDFRQIRFPSATNGLTQAQFSARGRTADGTIACSSCHSPDPRPIWEQYSSWPGAYGENDDEMGTDSVTYAQFAASRASHPRYKTLIQGSGPNEPYSSGGIDINFRPNLRFSSLIDKWDALRVQRLLSANLPRWQVMAMAIQKVCPLTPDQVKQADATGLDVAKDSDPTAGFGLATTKSGLTQRSWGTYRDFSNPADIFYYEFRAGFGSLIQNFAMSVVQDLAEAGDAILRDSLKQIVADFPNDSDLKSGNDIAFFDTMAEIIPAENEFFSTPYVSATAEMCPEFFHIFLPDYLKHAN